MLHSPSITLGVLLGAGGGGLVPGAGGGAGKPAGKVSNLVISLFLYTFLQLPYDDLVNRDHLLARSHNLFRIVWLRFLLNNLM